ATPGSTRRTQQAHGAHASIAFRKRGSNDATIGKNSCPAASVPATSRCRTAADADRRQAVAGRSDRPEAAYVRADQPVDATARQCALAVDQAQPEQPGGERAGLERGGVGRQVAAQEPATPRASIGGGQFRKELAAALHLARPFRLEFVDV